MKRTKMQKGITLVALIITIIVLLILAVVSIRAVTGDGIIHYAKNAKSEYELAQANEEALLQEYMNYLNNEVGGENTEEDDSDNTDDSSTLTVANSQGKVLSTTANTEVYDEYGNKIVVPAGFKITTDASHVTEGIVIEDVSAGTETVGSQFVWIPVGTVYTNVEKTESKTISLDRYTFASDGTATPQGDAVIEDYFQELATSTYGNATAKDLNGFISSATTKGGYYLGRYEARTTSSTARESKEDSLTTATCIKTNSVYNYVTQSQASAQSQAMYVSNSNYTSDLVNSYAWDTAIVFIQTFSGDSDYSRQTRLNSTFSATGTENDKVCNIYDMASNCWEWSTETSSRSNYPCVDRGGVYSSSHCYTSLREFNGTTVSIVYLSFRPLIYVAL